MQLNWFREFGVPLIATSAGTRVVEDFFLN